MVPRITTTALPMRSVFGEAFIMPALTIRAGTSGVKKGVPAANALKPGLTQRRTAQPRRPRRDFLLSSSRLLRGQMSNFGDRLTNLSNDLVRIGFGVRTAIFKVALVAVLDE